MSNSVRPMNCSLPVSSVLGVLQARILEWVAISFSRGSSQPSYQAHVSWQASSLPQVPPVNPRGQLQSFSCKVRNGEFMGFPGGSVVKNPPANAGDEDLIPGPRRSPAEGNDNPLQYSFWENPMDRSS